MTIETAKFVVQRAGVQSYCAGADLATKLQTGDLMAVTRPGEGTYKWIFPSGFYTLTVVIPSSDLEWYVSSQPGVNISCTVDWGDDSPPLVETNSVLTHTHVYASPGSYTVTIKTKGEFSLYGGQTSAQMKVNAIEFDEPLNYGGTLNYAFQSMQITTFPAMPNTGDVTDFASAWKGIGAITSFPPLDFSSAELLVSTWSNCSGLTSFPLIDTSNVTNFNLTWYGSRGLTSFPALDTSKGENFSDSWNNCQKLTSFPVIDVSNGTNFLRTWSGCQQLPAFPALTFNSGTSFYACWNQCYQLADFPANAFDVTGTLDSNAFQSAFTGPTSVASVENILVSLDTNGQSNVFLTLYGALKSTWTAAANTAYDNLIAKGWTIQYSS